MQLSQGMVGRLVAFLVLGALTGTACSSSTPPRASVPQVRQATVTAPDPTTARTTTTTEAGTAPAAARVGTCGWVDGAPATYEHVVWIWMENHRSSDVLGSPNAPYETALAAQCGSSAQAHDVGSPSLPNYLGATSGDTWGITDDAPPSAHPLAHDNLFRQVRDSGRRAVSYEEGMPAPCALAGSGRYAVKHNPAAYYTGPGDRAACQTDNVALGDVHGGALADALDGGTLPAFSFVTPDLCNDTHDCDEATGDRWLATWIPRIVKSATWRRGRSAIWVVWDEPTPMPLIVVAPAARPGATSAGPSDHYGLLRAAEETLGLPLLGRARTANSLRAGLGV